jgi:hypothetical protein
MTNISELKILLDAISTTRAAYETFVSNKYDELILTYKPKTDEDMRRLWKMALTAPETQIEFQKLLTVYGIVGAQSSTFSSALGKVAA